MNPDMFDKIAKYVPEEHLPEYWRMVSRLRKLRPDDEILILLQAMGVMTLVLHDLPSALIAERQAWKSQLDAFRDEISQMTESAAKQVVSVTNHAEVLNEAMVKNGLMIRESTSRLEKVSQEAVKQIDVDSFSDKISARIEERIVSRLDTVTTRAEHSLDVVDEVATGSVRAVKEWKRATVWPLVGGISAGILGLCLTLTGFGLKMIYDADQAALQTRLAEVQGMAETNKAAFALLAQNQIALEVAGVRDDSGQTLSGQKALNLTPASDVRLETAPDQSKRAIIFISVPQTSPRIFPPWRVGP